MASDPIPVPTMRVARPAADLARIQAFYVDVVGLAHLGGFEDHNGYDGVFIGVPGASWHVELTHHVSGHPAPAPTDEDLLVLYLDPTTLAAVSSRLQSAGHAPIDHPNPYWAGAGALVFLDPDGYGLVLCPED